MWGGGGRGGGEVGTCEQLVGIASFGLTAYPRTACDVLPWSQRLFKLHCQLFHDRGEGAYLKPLGGATQLDATVGSLPNNISLSQ